MEYMIANNQSLLNPIEYQPMLNDYNALFIGLYYSNAIANALHRLLINSRLPSIHLKIYTEAKPESILPKEKKKRIKLLSRLIQRYLVMIDCYLKKIRNSVNGYYF